MSGPHERHDDVTASVADVYAAFHKRGVMRAKSLDRLLAACLDSGVELGAYDRQVLKWVARQEPEVAYVIADLIRRSEGTVTAAPAGR